MIVALKLLLLLALVEIALAIIERLWRWTKRYRMARGYGASRRTALRILCRLN